MKSNVVTVEEKLEKSQNNGTMEEPNSSDKPGLFNPRSLPRRCLSVEEATTNHHRLSLAPALSRPASVYVEMEHMKRSQSTKTRRTRSNYPVGE